MSTHPYPIHTLELRECLERLEGDAWGVYLCDVGLVDGTTLFNCSIQCDDMGCSPAYETLEDENGRTVNLRTLL